MMLSDDDLRALIGACVDDGMSLQSMVTQVRIEQGWQGIHTDLGTVLYGLKLVGTEKALAQRSSWLNRNRLKVP